MEPPIALLPNEERTGVVDCLFRFDLREAGEDILVLVLGKEAGYFEYEAFGVSVIRTTLAGAFSCPR